MQFTAGRVYRRAILLAPEVQRNPPVQATVAQLFDEILAELISDVMDMEEERLLRAYTVPAAVVGDDPIDLTDDGGGTGTREWLRIAYIDWVDADGTDGEVYVATFEARHRALQEYSGQVVGYYEDQQRSLRKVSGWDTVETLSVHGIVTPAAANPVDLEDQQYDFPRALYAALRWEMLLELANTRGDEISGQRIAYWEAKRSEARDRLMMDAQDFALSRIDDIGL